MHPLLMLHQRATDVVDLVVSGVGYGDLARPTPCVDWSLGELLAHMTGQHHGFAAAVHGDVGCEAFAPSRDADPVTAHAAAAARVGAAFAYADPARTVYLAESDKRFPLATVVGFHLVDVLIHGWDVASSLGVPIAFDADLVASGLLVAANVPTGPARAARHAFDPPIAEAADGSAWHRTLRLLGRDPNWQPAQSRQPV